MNQPRRVEALAPLAVVLGMLMAMTPAAGLADTTPAASDPTDDSLTSPAAEPEPLPIPAGWLDAQSLLRLPNWLQLGLAFTAEPMANPLGGERPAASWLEQASLSLNIGSGLTLDPARWRELDHWSLSTTLTHTSGDGLYGQRIGALLPPQQIAYPSGFLLSEASLSRKGGTGWIDLKGGLVPINPDFVAAPILDFYVHSALNDTLNLSLNGVPISPYAALGGIVQVKPAADVSLRYGWFDLSSTKPLATWLGSPPPFRGPAEGAVQMLQMNWTPAALAPANDTPLQACRTPTGVRRHRSGCREPVTVQNKLPGALLSLGGYTTTRQGRGVYGSATLRSGLPLGLDERIWLGGAWAPISSGSLAPNFVAGGLVVQGPLPKRPLDLLVLGAGRAGLGPKASQGWHSPDEGMVELGYQWRLNETLALQPTLQWILNPSGGDRPLPGILTTSLQISLTF